MSHVIGTVPAVSPSVLIGPDSGAAASPANVWTHVFTPDAPPIGVTKFVILHFSAASFPAKNRLEVELGYDTDVFTSADGADLWTRPVDIFAVGGSVTIRYVADGAPGTGGVTFDKYGRGEQHHGEQDPTSLSNSDPFLGDATYPEPKYDPFWFCHTPPQWENTACVPVADFRLPLSRSIGMIVMISKAEQSPIDIVSSCSVTLIDADVVITAGHCLEVTGADAHTSSVIFNYATECDKTRPPGYAGRFVKVDKQLAWRFDNGFDYCLLRLKTLPGLPPIAPRTDIPAAGENIFGVHHPNGAVKKISPPHPGFGTVSTSDAMSIVTDIDISGGSSGSGLFDTSGRITGVLGASNPCALGYFPTATILQQIASPPAALPSTRDVMIVFDTSGSMSLDAGTGQTKMKEAHDAASLFVQLVQAGTGNRVGLVSFNTSASTDFDLKPVDKNALTGPAPFTGGKIGGLTAGGATSIGDGLDKGRLQFPAPGANPRSILLLTDGLQNTPPMIADTAGKLGGIAVDAIGFGTESNLDGALLTDLANAHDGLYHRAGDPLALRKFFALAFGTIFEAGALMDPDYVLQRDAAASAPIPFRVCGEETVTIVAGWDDGVGDLSLRVATPGGAVVTAASPGVESRTGATWTFLRIPLPHAGERDGLWNVEVVRPHGGGEFPPPLPELRFFVSVIASGGPRLTRFPQRVKKYYTGDTINPMVTIRYPAGGFPDDASVKLTVTRPDGSVGTALAKHGLGAPATVGGDTIPARQATLLAIEKSSGKPVVGYVDHTFDLIDGAPYNGGQLETSGIFGNPLSDLLAVEGNYTFHAVATYGTGCVATREVSWAVHVDVGIDPSRTTVSIATTGANPDGTVNGTITVTPNDRYGNALGPGRTDGFTASAGPGTAILGNATDNGDGSYTIRVTWTPSAGPPSVVVQQPGKDPVVVQPAPGSTPAPRPGGCTRALVPLWLVLLLLLILVVLVVLLILKP
jgi:hypothetical protein